MLAQPRIELEKPMCDDAAEGAAADHDDVERPTAACCAIERLLQRVADVSPRHIVRESRIFGREWHGDGLIEKMFDVSSIHKTICNRRNAQFALQAVHTTGCKAVIAVKSDRTAKFADRRFAAKAGN